jgi:hypothetical protein
MSPMRRNPRYSIRRCSLFFMKPTPGKVGLYGRTAGLTAPDSMSLPGGDEGEACHALHRIAFPRWYQSGVDRDNSCFTIALASV